MAAWYDSAVFYHIYPLGLCGAPKFNAGLGEESRLLQLIKWIPHIKAIGCNAIYVGPLFESVGHGYETTDYVRLDKRLGNNGDLKLYIEECHKAGIKVVLDGVFNHTGREFFAFKDLKEKREHSKYRDWYCNVNFYGNNEYNDGFHYDSWRGYNILVKLNQKNPEVIRYLFDVIRFWVREFDIDGIRLDAADVLDHDFMREMRTLANEIKEDFWLMGEVIHGDYSRWVNERMLHSVTNYELHKGLFSGHNDHNYFEIAHTVRRLEGVCSSERLYTFVDNHDVDRIWNKLNNKNHLFPVYMLLYTLPGIPSIYYGSEFAIEGKKQNGSDDAIRPQIDLFNYLTLEEQNGDMNVTYIEADYSPLLRLIMQLGAAKQKYEELTYGKYKELLLTNRQYAFGRIMNGSAVITAVNNDNGDVNINVPVCVNGEKAVDIISGLVVPIENGMLRLSVEGNDGRIIHVS